MQKSLRCTKFWFLLKFSKVCKNFFVSLVLIYTQPTGSYLEQTNLNLLSKHCNLHLKSVTFCHILEICHILLIPFHAIPCIYTCRWDQFSWKPKNLTSSGQLGVNHPIFGVKLMNIIIVMESTLLVSPTHKISWPNTSNDLAHFSSTSRITPELQT